MRHWSAVRLRPSATVPFTAALLAAAVLAGCTSDPQPRAQPLPPLSSTRPTPITPPPPTPSPTGPTAANAAAFVRAYYAAINRAAVTGKVGNIKSFVSPGCLYCKHDIATIVDLEHRAQHESDSPYSVNQVHAYPPSGLATTVTITLSIRPMSRLDTKNQRVESGGSGRSAYSESVALAWVKGRWKITDIQEFPS